MDQARIYSQRIRRDISATRQIMTESSATSDSLDIRTRRCCLDDTSDVWRHIHRFAIDFVEESLKVYSSLEVGINSIREKLEMGLKVRYIILFDCINFMVS